MKCIIRAILIVLMLSCATGLSAQKITGNLESRVLDEEGNGISFVTVSVTSPDLQGTRIALSGSNGGFLLPNLPIGKYTVTISHVSYKDISFENVTVWLGKTTTMPDIRLTTQLHEAPEIVVTETMPVIDITTTAIGGNLVSDEIDVLPIQRDYRQIPALLPMANTSFFGDDVNISGGTGLENRHFIDGIDVTDPWRGTTGMRLPYNFIREVEVTTGSYQAEYKSSLGGILNVVTNSGRNDFYGQAFGFFANNRFSGDSKSGAFEPNSGDFSQYDIGFSVGGSIVRDRLWYYAAYNPTIEKQQIEIPGHGYWDDDGIIHIFAAKLTWKAADRMNVALSVFGDPGERDAVAEETAVTGVPPTLLENPDPYLTYTKTGGVATSLVADYFVNDMLYFESVLSVSTRDDVILPRTQRGIDEPLYIDSETGIWSGGNSESLDNHSIQANAIIKGTVILGAHELKAGIEYRHLRTEMDQLQKLIQRDNDTTYTTMLFDIEGTVSSSIPSVFIQDSWQIIDRLRLNAGFRWDAQYLYDSNGNVAQRITDQYQPRIGLVFKPVSSGRQKLFGSFARFYQDLSLNLSSLTHIEGGIMSLRYYNCDPTIVGCDPYFDHTSQGEIHPEIEGLKGQHYDEFTLGYEIQLGSTFKTGITGVYRTLKEAVEDGYVTSLGEFHVGNPGSGLLSEYPKARRDYEALVLTVQRSGARHFNFIASYVLSRNEGNYSGLLSDFGAQRPNFADAFDIPDVMVDADGLVPNDRTHVLKFAGSYRLDFGFTIGTSFQVASGTPLSVRKASSWGPPFYGFAQQRGSAGRTPTIWDLNFRLAYDLPGIVSNSVRTRLLLDVFHLGSQLEGVNYDQIKYYDYNETILSPTYGMATRFQPPTSMRLGMEVSF